ncbi:MAG TPA: hypothetical protein PKC41_14200, partial [Chitinophagaceae bacterium]|nr:hypothetical protein [Chitinophagaceae bacterium]
MWDKLYVDNNYLHDHYGTGFLLTLGKLFTNYGFDCFHQNHEIEINNNQVKNVYGFDPTPFPLNALYDDGGDGISIVGVKGAHIDKNIVFNDMSVTGMCGRLGIGSESFTDCIIERNMINGYNRDIHVENDLGNILIRKNRCTGTYCNVLLSSNAVAINPNIITENYFSNENIPEDNEFWLWNGVQNAPISQAINWSYSQGMVYITSTSGAQYTGSTISQNEFFIDAYSGDYTSFLTRRYIHYNGFGDNFDMGLRINCNFFHHNHLNTPAYNLYGFMLEPEVPPIGPKKEIVKEFYGNIIDDAGSSWLNPQVPFSNDINYFHSNQVLGG